MMLAAMLALVLATAVPAVAQVALEAGNEAESEDLAAEFSVANQGDYASQCVPALQFGNTGNLNNAPMDLEYASMADDFEPGGIAFGVGGGLAVECASTIQQSSAASGK